MIDAELSVIIETIERLKHAYGLEGVPNQALENALSGYEQGRDWVWGRRNVALASGLRD